MTNSSNKPGRKPAAMVALMGSAMLFSAGFGTPALARAHHYAAHHYAPNRYAYRGDEGSSPYPWYINKPSEPGFGPAPTGQYPSFEMLDHFPGSRN